VLERRVLVGKRSQRRGRWGGATVEWAVCKRQKKWGTSGSPPLGESPNERVGGKRGLTFLGIAGGESSWPPGRGQKTRKGRERQKQVKGYSKGDKIARYD